MTRPLCSLLFALIAGQIPAQTVLPVVAASKQSDSLALAGYKSELKKAGRAFTTDFYPNYSSIYSMPEPSFTIKIDSSREAFSKVLEKYTSQLNPVYVKQQELEIRYYFDKLLVDYLLNYPIYTGGKIRNSHIPDRFTNAADLNNPALLSNEDFTNYVRALFEYEVNKIQNEKRFTDTDNRHLEVMVVIIERSITNSSCREYWYHQYLKSHIENDGIKDLGPVYRKLRGSLSNSAYKSELSSLYGNDSIGRQGHTIVAYKGIEQGTLDLHIFEPDTLVNHGLHPVMIYFHGGSWSEGKPDWFFEACDNLAAKGWVAVAVEYRTFGRHGTLPFAAVKDARSAVRWLRAHAVEYRIDPNRIVASGNSAGGHLVLCTALADQWNEATDNPAYSPIPDLLMVNSGVFDLTDISTAWIRKDLKDKSMAEKISPLFLATTNLPPTLLIHGTNDRNVPYKSAQSFANKAKEAGSPNILLHSLEGAGHFIWFEPPYADEVGKIRLRFLADHGY